MRVFKGSSAVPCGVGPEELEKINAFSRTPLTEEQVYTFCVRLCDNQVDRDFERFPEESLQALAPLFVGKTGIFDHQWSAAGQKARIYRTELVRETGVRTEAGDELVWLKGWAYMLRTEENENLIAEIDGGIKREVSVGCAVRWARCSVCGGILGSPECGHRKGREYEGTLCYGELMEPTDAFEWSFVAVPAQRGAGVIKAFLKEEEMTLRELCQKAPELKQELQALESQAELGRRWMQQLREKAVRLAGLAQPELEHATAKAIMAKLDHGELEQLCLAYEKGMEAKQGPVTQLGGAGSKTGLAQTEFMI